MMSRIIYVVILTSIIGCFGECFGVDIHVGQPTKLAQDGTYFDLYKRLEVLEDLRSKDDRESIEIRRTVEVQKNSLDQVLADLSTIKDKFGKLQRENEFLHTRLNIALEMSEKCEKKCSASEKGTFQEYGDTPKSDLDVVPENGTELQGDSRRTGPKLATKETTFSKPNYSFHGIRSSQVHQTGMKRVAESDPLGDDDECSINGADVMVTSIRPTKGGVSGGTKITLEGFGFSTNAPILGDGPSNENKVWLKGVQTYVCDVIVDRCTLSSIVCTTRALQPGVYTIGLSVDGVMVPTENICHDETCLYQATEYNTPLFTSFLPRTGPPDTLVTFKGRIFTDRYGPNSIPATSRVDTQILRVYLGIDECQMTNKTSELYGLALDSEHANTGLIKCKASEVNIDNLGFSIIVDGPYGRSKVHPDLTWLTLNNKLAVFQMYAYVTSVYPTTGSINGGTLLTVNGRGFDKDTTSVSVGGLDCINVNVVSTSVLTCITPARPQHNADHIFTGSRGSLCETWDLFKSFADLADVRELSAEDDGYQKTTLEDSYYSSSSSDKFVVRISGFLAVPFTANFRLMLKGCGGARWFLRNQEGTMEEIASTTRTTECESYHNNRKEDRQISEVIHLQQNRQYYYEIVHRHVDESSFVQWGMYTEDTPPFSGISEDETGALKMEEQQIHFSKAVMLEKQVLTIDYLSQSDDTYTAEIQEIRIDNPKATRTYRLKMFGAVTGSINSLATANEVQEAIQRIPVLKELADVTVTFNSNSPIYVVKFDSKIGDLPNLEPVNVTAHLVVTVQEITSGQSGRDTIAFTIGDSITPPLTSGLPTADDIRYKLETAIGARCPSFLTKNPFTMYSEDFENHPSLMRLGGEIVGNREPYCGRFCLKNPNFLYYKSALRAKPLGNNMLCLAYQGNVGTQLTLRCVNGNAEATETVDTDFTKTKDHQWMYRCVQLRDFLSKSSLCRQSNAGLVSINFTRPVHDYYIDVVHLGSKFTTTDTSDMIWKQRTSPAMAGRKMISSVVVKQLPSKHLASLSFEVTMGMHNCGHSVPLLKPFGGQEISHNVFEVSTKSGKNLIVTVKRLEAATPPIGGTVTFRYDGKEKKVPVGWDLDVTMVTDFLENIHPETMGSLEVTKTGHCADFSWTYKFLTKPGKQKLMEVVEKDSIGGPFKCEVKRKRTGRTEYDPCAPDQLKTHHHQPQVSVTVNAIPSVCSGNCDFDWADEATPSLISFTLKGRAGDQLFIRGTSFSVVGKENMVTVGDTPCTLDCAADSCSETQLVCMLGNGLPQPSDVTVTIAGKGRATTVTDSKFIYTSGIDSYSPVQGSLAGGTLITFNGYGIAQNVSVLIGSKSCPIVPPVTVSKFVCRTPAQYAGKEVVTVLIGDTVKKNLPGFMYNPSSTVTPTVIAHTLSVPYPTVLGGDSVGLTGSGFEDGACTKLLLVKSTYSTSLDGQSGRSPGHPTSSVSTDLVVISDTGATAVLPGAEPGVYTLRIVCQHGYALTQKNLQIEYQFAITAVHPLAGSIYGGTKVTFKGVGFGEDPSKISTRIGSHDCEIDPLTFGSTEFVCQVSRTLKTHHITNNGYRARYGIGYSWLPRDGQYEVGDIVQWSFKSPQDKFKMGIYELMNDTSNEELLFGFNSGIPVHTGTYAYELSKAGTHYYWSGFLNQDTADAATISFRGQFTVSEKRKSTEAISVKIGESDAQYTALHFVDSGVTIAPGDCELSVPDCDFELVSTTSFHFTFLPCLAAVVTSMSPTVATDKDDIIVMTSLPGNQFCHTEVTMGTRPCRVHRVLDDGVICRIDPGNDILVGERLPIAVRSMELGYALLAVPNANFQFRSRVINAKPEQGSIAGGTTLVITGMGLNGGTLMIGGAECEVIEESFTEVKCKTPRMSVMTGSRGNTRRSVQFFHSESPDGVLSPQLAFRYVLSVKLTSVSPKEVFGLTTIYLGGYGFGKDIDKVIVNIGQEKCVVKSVKDNLITCEIMCLSSELHLVEVYIDSVGLAHSDTQHKMLGRPAVNSVSPQSGSIYGGAKITITGNAFYEDSTKVTIGGKECQLLGPVSTCQVICELPPADGADLQPVEVKLGSTILTGMTAQFTYSSENTPFISSMQPSEGMKGQELTIEGEFFDAESPEVHVGGSLCAVRLEYSRLIVCKLGDHAAGGTDVVVMVPGYGRSAPQGDTSMFTYLLVVDTPVHPNTGPSTGNQRVTMTGAGFDPETTTVTFAGIQCDILIEQSSSEKLVISTPPGSGVVDIEITQGTLQHIVVDGYEYRRITSEPTIDSVSPRTAGTAGGTRVTVTGSNFGSDTELVEIDIAGVKCIVQSLVDESSVVCITDPSKGTRSGMFAMIINGKPVQMSTSDDTVEFHFVDKYSSPFTWGGSPPPVAGDSVIVSPEMTLMIDVAIVPVLNMLVIDGGTVIFDETQTSILLQAHSILIINNGKLQVGTEEKPYRNYVTIMLYGHHLTQEIIPIYGSKVLAVREGTLDLHGMPRSVWTRLAETAVSGTSRIVLSNPVNWRPGDVIVIATTGNKASQEETETRIIEEVFEDGHVLTLTEHLDYEHLGVTLTHAGHDFDVRAEVGLLSHNVKVIGSDKDSLPERVQACREGFMPDEFVTQSCFSRRFGAEISSDEFGAQIIVHTPEPSREQALVRINNTEITHAGQAFHRGRHPIHFHTNGDMSKSYIQGSAIHSTFNRALNIRDTSNLLVENNILFDVMGGGIVIEEGLGIGNVIQNNLAVFVRGSPRLLKDDIAAASFAIANPNNILKYNTAVGGTDFGFWYKFDHDKPTNIELDLRPQTVSGRKFYSNTAHSLGHYGLWVTQDFTEDHERITFGGAPATDIFDNFTTYLCEKAVEISNAQKVSLRNLFSLHNDLAALQIKTIPDIQVTLSNHNSCIQNGVVVGYDSRLPLHHGWDAGDGSAAVTCYGVVLPYGKVGAIDGVTFVNYDTLGSSAITFTAVGDACDVGFSYKVTQVAFINTAQRVKFLSEYSGVIEEDGSLTESYDASKLIVCSPPFLSICTKDFSTQDQFNHGSTEVCLCPSETKFHRLVLDGVSPPIDRENPLRATYLGGSSFAYYSSGSLSERPRWAMTVMENSNGILLELDEHVINISYSGIISDFNQGSDDTVNYLILCHSMKSKPDIFMYNGETERKESPSALTSTDKDGAWHYNEDTNVLCYIVSSLHYKPAEKTKFSSIAYTDDRPINVNMFKCRYDGCVLPDKKEIPPSCVPDTTQVLKTWEQFCNSPDQKCQDGTDVEIKAGVWVTMGTTSTAQLNKLIIRGALKVLNRADVEVTIKATYIVVIGGQLIIGCEEPFVGTANIVLLGSRRTQDFTVHSQSGVDIPIGAKVLASFGGLTLNGTGPKIPWTTLGKSAMAGDTSVTLVTRVTDWKMNDEILITATGYNPNEAEKRRIKSIINDGSTTVIELNSALTYSHTVGSENFNGTSYSIAAEIGDLTRNIKIVGEDYDGMIKEAFGARVVVGTWEERDTGEVWQGYARLQNTEFYHTGQEGWTSPNDPRFSIVYKDTGSARVPSSPSSLRHCVFHDGFNTAVGIFGAPDFLLEYNIVYHTVGAAIQTRSPNTMLYHNLVSLMLWKGTYGDHYDTKFSDYTGSIESFTEVDVVMVGNHISSSQRTCLNAFPHPCNSTAVTWRDNVVHTCLIGVGLFPMNEGQPIGVDCVRYTGVTSYKNWDFGFFYTGAASVEFDGVTVLDNGVGIWSSIHSSVASSHTHVDKYMMVNNSLVVLRSHNFDCDKDRINTTDNSYKLSRSVGRSFRIEKSGFVGVTIGSFTRSHNEGPGRPLLDTTTYSSIGGRTEIRGTTFANLHKCQNFEDRAISTRPNASDFIHPTFVQKVHVVPEHSNNKDRLFYLHHPGIGQMNMPDSVHMEHDGHKKVLIHDRDGSMLGQSGTVLSMSEGISDQGPDKGYSAYNIPRQMLLDTSTGNILDPKEIASETGIIRDPSCTLMKSWQAHLCTQYLYKMVIIESMDSDTETRSLSPIAFLGESGTINYLDLINGPKDGGTCFSNTCQKYTSTFAVVVANSLSYKLFFTNTPPQWLRLTMLHSETSHKVKIAIHYSKANRIDVFASGDYKAPMNSFYDEDEFMFHMDTATNKYKYIPTVSDDCGANFYESSTKLLHVIVCGDGAIDIRISQAVFLHLSLPTLSSEDPILTVLVKQLAQYVGVSEGLVKVREAISESTTRHKRSGATTTYVVQIADNPCNTTTCASESLTLEAVDLVNLANKLVNAYLLGQISDILNVTVNTLSVDEVLPPSTDPTWQTIVDSGNVTTVLKVLDSLQFHTPIIEDTEGNPFQQQPVLHFIDENGDHASVLGISAMPWEITATLRSGAGNSSGCTPTLTGTTTVNFEDGWANFTDLSISCTGEAYIIDFEVTSPTGTNFTLASGNLTILSRNVSAAIVSVSNPKYTGEAFNVTINLKDAATDAVIEDVGWKGHTWTAELRISNTYEFSATFSGTTNVTFDSVTGLAVFDDLVLDTAGIFKLVVEVFSSPAEYNFTIEQDDAVDWILLKNSTIVNNTGSVKYDLDYSVYGTTEFAKAACNSMMLMSSAISLSNCTASPGSVIVSFVLKGTNTTFDDFLTMLCNNISSTLSFSYNGTTATLDKYLLISGSEPTNCFPSDAGEIDDTTSSSSSILTILLAVLIVLVAILVLTVVIYCIKTRVKRRMVQVSPMLDEDMEDEDMEEPITEKPPGPPGTIFSPDPTYVEDPPHQLFRQDTFMAFKNYLPDTHMPPIGNCFRERPKTPKKFQFN